MSYDERIYNQAIKDGMPHVLAVLITAQARHETGNYISNVFRTCNNAFGYKWVGQATAAGPCVNSPENNAYAKYGSVEDSTHEVCLWIKRRQGEGKFPPNLSSITSPEGYATYLKNCGYYGSTIQQYTSGMLAALQKIGDTLSKDSTIAILAIIAFGLIVFRKKLFS